jgi:hypothetical protein
MKLFTIGTKKTMESRIISLTIFTKTNRRKNIEPEPDFSFAQLIGFDKTGGYFQEAKVPPVKS